MRGFLGCYLTQDSDFDKYLITCDELLEIDEDSSLDALVWERYNQLAKAKEQETV